MNQFFCTFSFATFAALLFGACANEAVVPTLPDHTRYFPVQEGQSELYRVVDINIDAPVNIFDTTIYYVQAQADTVIFLTNGGLYAEYAVYQIDSLAQTTVHSRFTRERHSAGEYAETYDNCRRVKARLPLREGDSWNAMVYCSDSDSVMMSRVAALHRPAFVAEILYDSVVTVIHHYDSSLVHLRVSSESWAAGVGLVRREETQVLSNSANLDFTLPIRDRVVTGRMVTVERVR